LFQNITLFQNVSLGSLHRNTKLARRREETIPDNRLFAGQRCKMRGTTCTLLAPSKSFLPSALSLPLCESTQRTSVNRNECNKLLQCVIDPLAETAFHPVRCLESMGQRIESAPVLTEILTVSFLLGSFSREPEQAIGNSWQLAQDMG
jgi:hypothetical protein